MRSLLEFLDVEARLSRLGDAPLEPEERERRRRAGEARLAEEGWSAAEGRRALRGDPAVRRRFALAWRAGLIEDRVELPGARRLSGWRVARGALGAAGLVLGVLAAQAASASQSGSPVNVWLFLGVLVVLPFLTLLLLAGGAAWARLRGGFLGGSLMGLARRLQRRIDRAGVDAGPRVRRVELWLAFSCSQLFAAAFAIGSLLGFAGLILFSELSFGWASTPDQADSSLLTGTVDALAAPWAWAAPEGWVPSDALVQASRWSAMEGAYPEAGELTSAQIADGWWPFLAACIAFWSLLPRLGLLGFASFGLRRALRRQSWDHRDLIELFETMLPTGEGWSRASAPRGPRPERRAEPAPPPTRTDGALAAVVWGGWKLDEDAWTGGALADLGLDQAQRLDAGGRDFAGDAQALERLTALAPKELYLLAEAGEAPDKRLFGFLREVRRRLPDSMLRVGLADWRPVDGFVRVPPRDSKIWRRMLDGLEDDRLWVGVLGPAVSEEDEDVA